MFTAIHEPRVVNGLAEGCDARWSGRRSPAGAMASFPACLADVRFHGQVALSTARRTTCHGHESATEGIRWRPQPPLRRVPPRCRDFRCPGFKRQQRSTSRFAASPRKIGSASLTSATPFAPRSGSRTVRNCALCVDLSMTFCP
jgi:hypothetical protein